MEINKPIKRTFWKTQFNEGITETNQITESKYVIDSSYNADDVFDPLPNQGVELTEGDIYSHNGGMVQVIQSHIRTELPPEQNPEFFTVYRANTEGEDWVANEEVIGGDTMVYQGETYRCIQSHVTQEGWEPPNVPALWLLL